MSRPSSYRTSPGCQNCKYCISLIEMDTWSPVGGLHYYCVRDSKKPPVPPLEAIPTIQPTEFIKWKKDREVSLAGNCGEHFPGVISHG